MGPEPSSALHRITQCRGERWLPFLKGPPFPSSSSSSALHSFPDLGQGAWLQPLMHQDRADHLLSDHCMWPSEHYPLTLLPHIFLSRKALSWEETYSPTRFCPCCISSPYDCPFSNQGSFSWLLSSAPFEFDFLRDENRTHLNCLPIFSDYTRRPPLHTFCTVPISYGVFFCISHVRTVSLALRSVLGKNRGDETRRWHCPHIAGSPQGRLTVAAQRGRSWDADKNRCTWSPEEGLGVQTMRKGHWEGMPWKKRDLNSLKGWVGVFQSQYLELTIIIKGCIRKRAAPL